MKEMLKKALAIAICAGVLAGCAGEEDTIIMAPVPQVDSEFSPKTLWSASVGDGVSNYYSKLTPAYAYGKVFVASRDGEVKALDPETGKLIWEQDVEEEVSARLSGGLTAGYSQIFIGSENGQVLALNEETGELNWRVDVDGEVLSAPATDNTWINATTAPYLLSLDIQMSWDLIWTLTFPALMMPIFRKLPGPIMYLWRCFLQSVKRSLILIRMWYQVLGQ